MHSTILKSIKHEFIINVFKLGPVIGIFERGDSIEKFKSFHAWLKYSMTNWFVSVSVFEDDKLLQALDKGLKDKFNKRNFLKEIRIFLILNIKR